ncbi:MAG: 2-amino-4-hydroxy-6-hydroxymethyldihydropteridine diphosphokinase [Bacteroidota bacterium]|jgi:2-amino-4-hydroxy-6-hydroxymethyldihydropteridine diphosphokinase
MPIPTRYIILLGSNVGDRMEELRLATEQISEFIGAPDRLSSVYETAAWGKTDQGPFLNRVVSGLTRLDALSVLKEALTAERIRGRIRGEKWSPRIIDIDLLFLGDHRMDSPELVLPHPMLHLRRFTLVPLCEIFPEFRHPVLGRTIRELLDAVDDPLPVHLHHATA